MTTLLSTAHPRHVSSSVARQHRKTIALLAPALAFFAMFYLWPLTDMARLSVDTQPAWKFYARVFEVPLYGDSLVRTLSIAATVAGLCALFGYPTALLIHRSRGWLRWLLLSTVVLPYFISILIRTYSWMVLLGRNGPINKLLLALNLIDEPLSLIYTRAAVLASMSAVLLPLLVLTVLGALTKLDSSLERAARAHGASRLATFWEVTFPLTLPALCAASLLIFISALGFFITPSLVGGPGDQMFAMHITQQADFLASGGFLQALAMVLLMITLLVIALAGRLLGLQFIWGGRRTSSPGNDRLRTYRLPLVFLPMRHSLSDLGVMLLRLANALPDWISSWCSRALAWAALLALVLPITIGALISFSRAVYMTFPPPGYSWRWYVQFFGDTGWMQALGTSLLIATGATIISVALGIPAAYALVRATLRAKTAWMTLFVGPLVVPPVVLGLSLYSLYLQLNLVGSLWALAAAHAIGGIPLVIVMVAASLQSVDIRQEHAAAVHGASPWLVFLHVTLPAISPSVLAAAFFAFLHSFDDLVLSMFLSSARVTTLPLRLWGNVNYKLDPMPSVVATLEVALIAAGLLILYAFMRSRRNSLAKFANTPPQ